MLYQNKNYVAGLLFMDIFPDVETFEDKVPTVGGLSNTDELFEVLNNRYMFSETRYATEGGFINTMKYKLQVIWPAYNTQKDLFERIQALELQEIEETGMSIINQLNNPNIPTVNPSTTPIPNISSTQQTSLQKINKLEALRLKYDNAMRDYLTQVYDAMDTLFVQILSDERKWVYPEE